MATPGASAASPYRGLGRRAFWRTGVAIRGDAVPRDIYAPRFEIGPKTRIATAGSCFAQHLGRALNAANCRLVDTEALPKDVPDDVARRFGYRLYSARYGNIYTTRQFAQLLAEAEGEVAPALPVWDRDGRFFDAQRPTVEPDGLESADLVRHHRSKHLARVKMAFRQAEVLIFTLGLTETWMHRDSGTVYPTAPGTVAGSHDDQVFALKSLGVEEVIADLRAIRSRLKASTPEMRILLTVSPVALTATASGDHVEVANARSKAILRAAAAAMVAEFPDVDYFPSFEIVTSRANHGSLLSTDLRDVTAEGVERVMSVFFAAHGLAGAPSPLAQAQDPDCEDMLLEAFAR